jgi:hypothetical protein
MASLRIASFWGWTQDGAWCSAVMRRGFWSDCIRAFTRLVTNT